MSFSFALECPLSENLHCRQKLGATYMPKGQCMIACMQPCAEFFFRVGSGNARLGVHHVELALGHAWAS